MATIVTKPTEGTTPAAYVEALEKARSALKNALHTDTTPAEKDTDDLAAKIAEADKKLKKEAK